MHKPYTYINQKKGAININRKTQIIFSQQKRKFKMRAETKKKQIHK